jgi:transcriptional regulator with XRE-family HTH domain
MSNSYDTGNRLLALIKSLKSNQKAFAKSIGVSQSFVYQMISGQKQISSKVIKGISNAYSMVNTNWLFTGNGSMYLEHEKPPDMVGDNISMYTSQKLTIEDLPNIIDSMRSEIADLRSRITELEKLLP